MSAAPAAIHRFEVRPAPEAGDAKAGAVARAARSLGVEPGRVRTARVYLVEGDLSADQVDMVRTALLTDPVLERSALGAAPPEPGERTVEVHPLPGVMDPAAQTVREAVADLTGAAGLRVSTGWRYDLAGVTDDEADRLASGLLANAVVDAVHREPWTPRAFPEAAPADQTLRRVPITGLDDEALARLSRDGHLFLSPDEMRAVRDEYRELGREPTDVELETIAQTWSEHCVHKTLKSVVRYTPHAGDPIDWSGRPGHTVGPDGVVTIDNLLKSTVAAATHELIAEGVDWTLSVFVDNAGIVRFEEGTAVCVKVETHNHPSAIEPYGGAATGIGGCIRDIMGAGLGARPVASTDVFCVAPPDTEVVPPGCLHPRRVLTRVIDGVRDYGNRMGIPTVNGAVDFDPRYVGNPLVFCGCVGVIPDHLVGGEARPGDRIVALGGRTGRDGIHGATFSSAELTHTHADEFSHAVQIGAPIEQKKTLDAILRARDAEGGPLYTAVTDCGAGGFSSAIGEMGEAIGAVVALENAPLKYDGLRYDEIWISESQERMVLSVPPGNVAALRAICDEEGVELADLGVFGESGRDLVLTFRGEEVGRLPMDFLHDGIPMPTREASWTPNAAPASGGADAPPAGARDRLLALLARPDIASKRWIVRQYDHEVQGNTVTKPLVGPGGIGPGDGAVIQPVPGSSKGLAIACGLQTPAGDPERGGDPYRMALEAIDECVRNLVCVGADPGRIAILDNFCWPSCADPTNLGALVRAAVGCYDGAKAYRTPFVSGKDSLNNQFTYDDPETGETVTIRIPPTLLITGIGVVPDVARCVTMDLKPGAGAVALVSGDGSPEAGARAARFVAGLIEGGRVAAAHDCSEGGAAVALAEMVLAGSGAGARVALADDELFREAPSRYVLQLTGDGAGVGAPPGGVSLDVIGRTTSDEALAIGDERVEAAPMREAFLGTLDW